MNLKLLVEGEEETGSGHLRQLLRDNRERLGADLIVFSDTLMWHADHPALCLSIRGTMLAQLEILGPLQDVHSGAVSGPAPNPIIELSRLLGQLHDDKGRITVPGLYDDVVEPSQRFRDEPAALPYTDEDWLQRSRTRSVGGETGYPVLERLWARPAIEVTSVIGGAPVGPSQAAVPSVVTADLSIRYVNNQTGMTATSGSRSTGCSPAPRPWPPSGTGFDRFDSFGGADSAGAYMSGVGVDGRIEVADMSGEGDVEPATAGDPAQRGIPDDQTTHRGREPDRRARWQPRSHR